MGGGEGGGLVLCVSEPFQVAEPGSASPPTLSQDRPRSLSLAVRGQAALPAITQVRNSGALTENCLTARKPRGGGPTSLGGWGSGGANGSW